MGGPDTVIKIKAGATKADPLACIAASPTPLMCRACHWHSNPHFRTLTQPNPMKQCSAPCAPEVNKKRTKQENVCVAFNDGDGMFLASAESYGADKLWCLLKPIPIELDEDDDEAQVNEPLAKRACV